MRLHALEDILRESRSGLLVVLDSIEDAGNLGAIIRTAAAVAADGVLVSLRRSAPLNETVWRTSAGALAKVKVAGSHNLAQDLEKLKEKGFWIVATSPRASLRYYEFDFKPPTALIFGSEARGVSPLLLKRADALLTIPHSAAVESLNVAAAAAVLLLEAFRQKSAGS